MFDRCSTSCSHRAMQARERKRERDRRRVRASTGLVHLFPGSTDQNTRHKSRSVQRGAALFCIAQNAPVPPHPAKPRQIRLDESESPVPHGDTAAPVLHPLHSTDADAASRKCAPLRGDGRQLLNQHCAPRTNSARVRVEQQGPAGFDGGTVEGMVNGGGMGRHLLAISSRAAALGLLSLFNLI